MKCFSLDVITGRSGLLFVHARCTLLNLEHIIISKELEKKEKKRKRMEGTRVVKIAH